MKPYAVWRPSPAAVWRNTADGSLHLNTGGYGFGLRVWQTCGISHLVAHSGGLPGFGSHMRWLPEHGVGIIAMGILAMLIQFAVSILNRDKLRDETGDPWGGRTLEWATSSPPPEYNFAFTPVIHDIDAWHDMKERGAQRPLAGFRDILGSGEPVCGRLHPDKNALLYGPRVDEVQSSALLSLPGVGLVAVGSRDPNRFFPGMGTLFLRMMGEALAAGLQRFPRG